MAGEIFYRNGIEPLSLGLFYNLKRTLAVHCGNGFDAGLSPYQNRRLSQQSCLLSLGNGYAATRVHHASRRCGNCVAADCACAESDHCR